MTRLQELLRRYGSGRPAEPAPTAPVSLAPPPRQRARGPAETRELPTRTQPQEYHQAADADDRSAGDGADAPADLQMYRAMGTRRVVHAEDVDPGYHDAASDSRYSYASFRHSVDGQRSVPSRQLRRMEITRPHLDEPPSSQYRSYEPAASFRTHNEDIQPFPAQERYVRPVGRSRRGRGEARSAAGHAEYRDAPQYEFAGDEQRSITNSRTRGYSAGRSEDAYWSDDQLSRHSAASWGSRPSRAYSSYAQPMPPLQSLYDLPQFRRPAQSRREYEHERAIYADERSRYSRRDEPELAYDDRPHVDDGVERARAHSVEHDDDYYVDAPSHRSEFDAPSRRDQSASRDWLRGDEHPSQHRAPSRTDSHDGNTRGARAAQGPPINHSPVRVQPSHHDRTSSPPVDASKHVLDVSFASPYSAAPVSERTLVDFNIDDMSQQPVSSASYAQLHQVRARQLASASSVQARAEARSRSPLLRDARSRCAAADESDDTRPLDESPPHRADDRNGMSCVHVVCDEPAVLLATLTQTGKILPPSPARTQAGSRCGGARLWQGSFFPPAYGLCS